MSKRQARRLVERVKNITLLVIMFILFCWCSWYESHYTREATVINVNNDMVTVLDMTDNVWEFEGDGFTIGDNVKMSMDTRHTDSNIYDDEIVSVKIVK